MDIKSEFYTWGNITLEVKKTVTLEGYVTPLTVELVFPQYEKTVKSMLEGIDPQSPNASKEYERILHNARWYPTSLPTESLNPQGIMFLGKTLPKWSHTLTLWRYVKSLNPTDNSREGNVNWLDLEGNIRISVGSYWGMVLGIPQSRISPNGGIAGTAHPAVFLAKVAALEGANFTINSLSPMYDKARNILSSRQAKEAAKVKAEAEAAKAAAEAAAKIEAEAAAAKAAKNPKGKAAAK